MFLSKRDDLKYRGNICLNCNHPLDKSDRYCPNCAQLNSTKKTSFWDLIEEFFGAIISYDSKIRKTLSSLILHPGKISEEYNQGKRMRYTNPFRFFLSLTFIYFILISFSSDFKSIDYQFEKVRNISTNEIQDIEAGIFNFNFNNQDINDSIQEQINTGYRKEYGYINKYFDTLDRKESFIERLQTKSSVFKYGIDHDNLHFYEQTIEKKKIKDTYENKVAFKIANNVKTISTTPSVYLAYFISKLPFIIFFFIPIFAVFIWLVYSKKKYNYMDHLVFCYHSQTMLILLFIISALFNIILNTQLLLILFLIYFGVYLFLALKKFYNQGFILTFVKYVFLNTIFSILALISVLLYGIIVFIIL